MNTEYIQHLRKKLQNRVRRLNSASHQLFHVSLQQFWGFINSYPIFVGILDDLAFRYPHFEAEVQKKVFEDDEPIAWNDELEGASAAYFVIKKCVSSDHESPEVSVGLNYTKKSYDTALDFFRELYLEPLYEYLDEQLDDQRAILALLRRYKQKCEWFQRTALYDLFQKDTSRGEKNLALNLYEYLHDQGIDFLIESWSISGEVDLISAQQSDDPLIADVKIFSPGDGRGKSYIAKGFNQIYQYTLDYNEPFGYLIIFNISGQDIRFALSTQIQSTPFVIHNNKTIFLVAIDVFTYETSASGRGQLKTQEITEDDLIQIST